MNATDWPRFIKWSTFSVPGNRVCWSVHKQITVEEYQDIVFRKSNWGPEAIDDMVHEVRDLQTFYGSTVGTLIDYTPKESISKICTEEKVFTTWHYGRTVLIGDGKKHPIIEHD